MVKNKTPEQFWEEVKVKIFKNGDIDRELDNTLLEGFRASQTEREKWTILKGALYLLQKDMGKD